jgi:hypothetical protein
MKAPKRLLALVTSLIILALIATMSLASTRSVTHDVAAHADALLTPDEPLDDDCASIDEPCEDPGDDDAEAPADTADHDADDQQDPVVDPEREAACTTAAAIDPTDGTDDGADTKLHGIDNAISHVLANCVKNPQSLGLLNALEHLVANKAKHEAHEAEKAERKAAHDAAKAQKHADGPGHGKGHGSDGEHGNPHDGVHGNPHGDGGNGHGGSHGNGHEAGLEERRRARAGVARRRTSYGAQRQFIVFTPELTTRRVDPSASRVTNRDVHAARPQHSYEPVDPSGRARL